MNALAVSAAVVVLVLGIVLSAFGADVSDAAATYGITDAAPLVSAVFPFRNETGDTRMDWVSIGLQDAVNTDLMYLHGFDSHIARNLGWSGKEPNGCGAELFMEKDGQPVHDHAWIGSYKGSADRLSVKIEVCVKDKSRTGAVRIIEGAISALPALTSQAVLALAEEMGKPAVEEEKARVLSVKTRDAEAWRLNAEGFRLQQLYTAFDRKDVAPLWEKALVDATLRDPAYAEAWDNLGWRYAAFNDARAEGAFTKALELKPDLIDALLGKAMINSDKKTVLSYFLKAVSLNDSLSLDMEFERIMFDAAAAQHKVKYRDLLKSRAANVQAVRAVTLEQLLDVVEGYPRGTALLFYDYTDEVLSSWLILNGEFAGAGHVKIKQERLMDAVDTFRKSIVSNDSIARRAPRQRGNPIKLGKTSEPHDYKGVDRMLSRLLFPRRTVEKLGNSDNLLIVPALSIGTVPFAAMKLFASQDTESFLIDRSSITVATDLGGLLAASPSSRSYKFSRALIVGNPAVETDPEYIFPSLSGAESEAREIAVRYNTEPLLGHEATLGRVRRELEFSDLLYFASHGIADDLRPLDGSFLALASDNDSNGRLTAREIQQKRLRAKLVVLSACQTGLGRSHEAGIIGLARAFTIAGADRVVMSLWNVSDEATYSLMQHFTRALERMQPAAALRSAIIETRKIYPKPSEWASFQVFGR